MERRSFFRNLALGAAALPVVALAARPEKPVIQRALARVTEIPPEAGKVNCIAACAGRVWVGCDNGLWGMDVSEEEKK